MASGSWETSVFTLFSEEKEEKKTLESADSCHGLHGLASTHVVCVRVCRCTQTSLPAICRQALAVSISKPKITPQ